MLSSERTPASGGPDSHVGRHYPPLDGLRGTAILLVAFHNSISFPTGAPGLLKPLALLATVGWIGVHLFFVLSGFLITGQLLDSRRSPHYFRNFFARRTLRIFPLYFATLLVALVIIPYMLSPTAGGERPHPDQIWLWTFLFNWAHPLGASSYGLAHFWSLAVEEQFYFAWPIVLYCLSARSVGKCCIYVALGALAIRLLMVVSGASADMIYEFTVSRMDALATGALLAVAIRLPDHAARLQARSSWLLPTAAVLALGGALTTRAYTRDLPIMQIAGHTILAASFALMLAAAVLGGNTANRAWQVLLSARWLRSVGKYSYAMYVFHVPITLAVPFSRFAVNSTATRIAYATAVVLFSYVSAFVSFHVFERHFLKMKQGFSLTPRVAARPA
jgi:peptidoglycan/LPS O-acetylase OafA/YrhL